MSGYDPFLGNDYQNESSRRQLGRRKRKYKLSTGKSWLSVLYGILVMMLSFSLYIFLGIHNFDIRGVAV